MNGVDIEICSFFNMMCEYGYFEIVRFLLNYGVNVNICDEDGFSLLYFVCEEGYFEIVELLLDKRVNIDIVSKY